MVFIKGGCFDMGDTFGDGEGDEKPVHTVCVDNFYIGKYEVTQREWVAVMGSNPSSFRGCDTCPVESVSWNDAQEYISKRNGSMPREAGENWRSFPEQMTMPDLGILYGMIGTLARRYILSGRKGRMGLTYMT